MSEFINTADAIGDDELCDRLLTGILTDYKEDRITKIGTWAFFHCKQLTVVDVPNVVSIAANAFSDCNALEVLVLRNSTVCTLSNTNAFAAVERGGSGTPIKSGTGYIYVPSALLASYQAATNWSTYADQFRAIEDYEIESASLNTSELVFTADDPQTLTISTVPEGRSVVWHSSDNQIASVNSNGVVTPRGHGTAIITVYSLLMDTIAQCEVTVSAEVEFTNILAGVEFNKGYLSNGTAAGTGSDADVHTDKFNVSGFAEESIVITLYNVTTTPANSRICYYDANNAYISQTNGSSSANSNVTITSTVPANAVFAAISIARNTGLSRVEITQGDALIGFIDYEGVKTT